MKKYKILTLLILLNVLFCSVNVSATIMDTDKTNEVNLTKEDTEDTEDIEDTEFSVLTDAELIKLIENSKNRLEENPNNLQPLFDLYSLIKFNGMTNYQVEMVLENGFLHDHIDEFKAIGALQEDYVLPENIVFNGYTIPQSESYIDISDQTVTPDEIKHDFTELNSSAEASLVMATCDDADGNVYVNILETTDDAVITTDTIKKCALNLASPTIYFRDEAGKLLYQWIFSPSYVDPDSNEINLKINRSENKLEFLHNGSLFRPVSLIMLMEKPDTEYVLTLGDTEFGTFISDSDGYIIIDSLKEAKTYYVSEKKKETNISSIIDKESTTVEEPLESENDSNTINYVYIIISVILLLLGLFVIIFKRVPFVGKLEE